MENSTVENVEIITEDVLKLGKYLDLVGELQFKQQVKVVAASGDVESQKLLKLLAKISEHVSDKVKDLESDLEDAEDCNCDCY